MLVSKSVSGIELKAGDLFSFGWRDSEVIKSVAPGKLEAGAEFHDVKFESGRVNRCWSGFAYSVLVEVKGGA